MKRNISDLLERYPAEDMELGGTAPYSPSRIKEIVMNNIHTETNTNKSVRRFRPVRLLIAVAAVAALSVSALAAGRLWGGELFRDVFEKDGGSALSQGQMETIERLAQTFEGQDGAIPAAVTDNGATITPLAALADGNIYYLRLRVEAPEGTVLPDLNPDTDCYQLFGPEDADDLTLEPAQGAYPAGAFAYQVDFHDLPDSQPDDNIKEFVVQFTNLSDKGIALNDGVSKLLTLRGLWVRDANWDYTPVFTGSFAFDIGLNFQSQTVNLPVEGLVWHNDLVDYVSTMQAMTLSPLSLLYRVEFAKPVNDQIGTRAGALEIVLKDGTVFYSDNTEYGAQSDRSIREAGVDQPLTDGATGEANGMGVFESYIVFDQPLDLSQVDYVRYGDRKLPVNAG